MRRLQLSKLLGSPKHRSHKLVLAMVAQRILRPMSKLATVSELRHTTLAQQLQLDNSVDENDLYTAMDWLYARQLKIEKNLVTRHLSEHSLVLYDVSSSYYEGKTCALMQFGYSRDGKRGRPIVVYGVLADEAGRPLAVQAYPGNTRDPLTVSDQVNKLRQQFGLTHIVLVGDRGMLTQTQIDTLKEHPGVGWISALTHDGIRQLAHQGVFQPSLFDHFDLAEIRSDDYPGERLVVCFNPLLKERRMRQREELLVKTEEALVKIQKDVARRTKKPLTAKEIAHKVGRVDSRFKMAKHFQYVMEDNRFEYARNATTLARESELDGFYVLRTDQPAERMSTADVVRNYKRLAQVEQPTLLSGKASIFRSVRFDIAPKIGCGRIFSSVCWRIMCSGICDRPSSRCCIRKKNRRQGQARWHRRCRPSRCSRKKPGTKTAMDCHCTDFPG